MPKTPTFVDYVNDQEFVDNYSRYQSKYAKNIRESDRVILNLTHEIVQKSEGPLKLLDIGCSTGNLLLHLKQSMPALQLTGGEMPTAVLEANRANPELEGVGFEYVDATDFEFAGAYDIIVASATFCLFPVEQYTIALKNCVKSLKAGGSLILFGWYHPFEQDLTIVEKSVTHPEGMTLYFRPYSQAKSAMEEVGLSGVEFMPFRIPVDLEAPSEGENIGSRTIKNEDGERMLFRGALYQPWCHVVARKA